MTDYNLRNKASANITDEETLIQRIIERILSSDTFIDKISSKIGSIVASALDERINGLVAEVDQLKIRLREANHKIAELEQYSRINNLRIYGREK